MFWNNLMVREVYYLALKAEEKLTRKPVVAKGKKIAKVERLLPPWDRALGQKGKSLKTTNEEKKLRQGKITPEYQ